MIEAAKLEADIYPAGPRGLSAYEIYKKEGGQLSEEEWLKSLNGLTPTIGENGNWFLGTVDTGLPSRGPKGDTGSIKFIVVTELPTENIDETAIYLKPVEKPTGENKFEELIYVNGKWEDLGTPNVAVDLSNYYTKEESNEKLDRKQDVLTAGENIIIEGNVISASGDEGIKTIDMTNNLTTNEVIALEPGIYALIGSGYIQSFGSVSGYNLIIVLKNQFNQRNCYIVKENGNIYYYMPSSGNSHLVIRYDKMLMTDNTKPYTPSADYNPATKKYVDDQVGNINTVLATLTTVSEVTK